MKKTYIDKTTNSEKFNSGQYKDKSVIYVAQTDPQYLQFVRNKKNWEFTQETEKKLNYLIGKKI